LNWIAHWLAENQVRTIVFLLTETSENEKQKHATEDSPD
jgi:hypothetical protein